MSDALNFPNNPTLDETYSGSTGAEWAWDGIKWNPGGGSSGGGPAGTAGGDLSGNFPNPIVDGLQGHPILATVPTAGQVLEWSGSAWAPATVSGGGPGGAAGGDLNGAYPNPIVDGLQGRPVAATTPAINQVLQWSGTTWAPATASAVPVGPASGDLTGNYPNPTVNGLQGYALAVTPPTSAQVLQWSGTAWTPTTITAPPSGSAGGDLRGTYPNPVVTGLQGQPVAVLAPTTNQVLVWSGSAWTPAAISVAAATIVTVNGTGTVQGTATAISSDYNIVGTISSTNNSFVLAGVSSVIRLINPSSIDAQAFPPSGSQIGTLGTNNAAVVPAYGQTTFIKQSATQWIAAV